MLCPMGPIDRTAASPSSTVAAVLDIEASGFGRRSFPLEIGFVMPDGRAYCSLIRPAPDWTHWDPQAQSLHGITLESARRHGRDVVHVADTLNEQLRGMTVYCDGWAHDYVWLNMLYEAAQRVPSFRLEHLRALLNEQQAAGWAALKAQASAEMKLQRHRASSDARVLQRALTLAQPPLALAPPA